MNREKIDEFLELSSTVDADEKALKRFFGVGEEVELSEELAQELIREFITDIEQNNYEYLISKLDHEEYRFVVVDIISYFSSDKNDDKRKLIEEREKYGLYSSDIIALIKSINDPEFTKECMAKKEEYGFGSYDIVQLIKLINDPEYTKKCIEEGEKYGFNSNNIIELIKLINDPEFTKECMAKREEYGFGSYDIVQLIKLINDPEYTKKCIEEGEKYGFNSNNIIELIKLINDPEYTKKCIEEREKYGLYGATITLIISLNDPEFIKECIKNKEKYRLASGALIKLIKLLNDPEFTKECIKNREYLKLSANEVEDLIISLNDPEFTKECIKNRAHLGLSEYEVKNLIISLNDPEFTKECIIKNRAHLGLSEYEVKNLIISLNDPEFTKECIKNREYLELSEYEVKNLIISLNDPEYTKKCLENIKEFGFYEGVIVDLIKSLNDPEYAKKCIEDDEKFNFSKNKRIELIKLLNDPEYTIMICKERRQEYHFFDADIFDLITAIDDPTYIMICLKDYKELDLKAYYITNILYRFPDLFMSRFDEILSIYENDDIYEEFIRMMLGEVELDKNKKPLIPKELKDLFSTKVSFDLKEEFVKKLPEIIAKWDLIQEQIQYKKAKNLQNGGLEVRKNIREIFNALQVLNRRSPQTPSEFDLENTPGSENIGQDTSYTAKPETAVERAYDIAAKMDAVPPEKKFPDFSTESGDIVVEVVHPQDKSAILLGYQTHCCFRPNGNADESARSEYSLFQYCTTTPYGGILRCKGKSDGEIYMGTPMLRNGNMLMFHSYETEKESDSTESNIALEEAAKRAIELSGGQIKAVFMTDLHTGPTKLHTDERLAINSYFRHHTAGEYEKYEKMYTNLNQKNVVLAIYCDGKILTGEEVIEWFNKECNGDEKIFKEKLGLHFGEVEESYEFPRRMIKQEVTIENAGLVDKFHSAYLAKGKERTVLALLKQRQKIQSKRELSEDDSKQLQFIEKELEKYPEAEAFSDLSEDELIQRLEENAEESLRIFSGDSIKTISEYYGITEEAIRKKLEEKAKQNINTEGPPKSGISKKSKLVKSSIIAQIKQSGNSELVSLISKIAKEDINQDELEKLEQAGIDTSEYIKIFIMKDVKAVDQEKALADKIRNKAREMGKNPRMVEEVLAEEIFSEITEEEIKARAFEDTITELKASVFEYCRSHDDDGIITEIEREEINQKIHELNLEQTLEGYIKNGFTRDENFEKIMAYGINIEAIYNKYANNIEGEKRKIRLSKFDKLKASITVGIRKKETWLKIKEKISDAPETTEPVGVEKVVFGNSWYIEYSDGTPAVYVSKDASEQEIGDLKSTLKREISIAKAAKTDKPLISLESIREATSIVTLGDKEKAAKIIADVLREIDPKGDEEV